jgi:hypothetical protein
VPPNKCPLRSTVFSTKTLGCNVSKSIARLWLVLLERQKIVRSTADYWVFVLIGSKIRSRDFILIEPAELLRRLDAIHGKQKRFQLYLWVTEKERYWDARGLSKLKRRQIAEYTFEDEDRDFTTYLDDWHMVECL